MHDERVIKAIKQFIENPNGENAMRMFGPQKIFLDITPCQELDDWNRLCRECIWNPICRHRKVPSTITDEEMSGMVLEAVQLLAMYEAKNA